MSILIKGMEMPKHAGVNEDKDTVYRCIVIAHPDNSAELVISTDCPYNHRSGGERGMPEKLKPCPFCGGEVEIINAEDLTINGKCYVVHCDNCKSETCFWRNCLSEEQTTTKWNRRAENDL